MSLLNKLYSFGPVRSFVWRMWYPFVTRRLQGEEVLFLNYGFETEPPMALALSPAEEVNRACIQLYHHVGTQMELAGRHVLEISCGHGGGAAYLTRTLRPATYTAVDLNAKGVRQCQERHHEPTLTFVCGDAENLPFAAETVDVVINVEASHCYAGFSPFLGEVARVLRPGGHFLYADFRFADEVTAWQQALASSPLELVKSRDISANVVRGLDRNAIRSQDLIRRFLPKPLHAVGGDFAGLPGSRIHAGLQSGAVVYHTYCFVKPAAETGVAR